MPRLNTVGSALCGVSAGLSIDGAVPAALSGVPIDTARWMTDTLAIFQNNSAGSVIGQYNTVSHAVTTIDSDGLNRLGAGGGKFVAWLAGGPLVGVRSNIAGWTRLPSAAVGDMSEAGLVALNTNYSTGRGISLYDAAGVQRFTVDELLTPYNDPIPCRSGLVMYSTASGWLLRTVPTGTPLPQRLRTGINYAVPVQLASGGIWVVERGDNLSIRQKDSTDGFIVNAGLSTDTFNPDAREISPGVVRICWTTNAGESPTSLQEIDLTLATGANRTAVVSGGALVWTDRAPLAPVNLVSGTPTLRKWVGWYYSSGRYGDYRPKQNCTVLSLTNYKDGSGTLPPGAADTMRAAAVAAGAIFCAGSQEDIDVMKSRWDLVAGLVTNEGTAADISTEAALFRANLASNGLPSKPIIATLRPGQLAAGWTAPTGCDAYAPEVYFDAPSGSYAAQYAATMSLIASYVSAAAGVPLYLIAQAYDRANPAWAAAVDQIAAIIDACGAALITDS